MRFDFSKHLSQSEVQALANLYTTGTLQETGVNYPEPVEWDDVRLETVLNGVINTCTIEKLIAPKFVYAALDLVKFVRIRDSEDESRRFTPDAEMSRDIDVAVPKGKFNAMPFAIEFVENYTVVVHKEATYFYTGEQYRMPDGEKFGGRYVLVSPFEMRRKIAERFPKVVASVGSKAVDAIATMVMLRAPQINDDLSDHRELLIMADGGVINTAGVSDTVFHLGSRSFFSRTLVITSRDYLAAPNDPESLMRLATLQVGAQEAVRWAKCLVEAGGFLIAGLRERLFIVLQGASGSFKTTFVNTLLKMWPNGSVDSHSMDSFGGRFALEKTALSAFISFADASSGKISPSVISRLKQITGGDYVQVDVRYNGQHSTQIDQPVVVTTNNTLCLNDAAAESRAVTISFYTSFTVAEGAELLQLMESESLAIFKCCLQAHFNRRREGRPLVGYSPLNSFVQLNYGPERWEYYIPRFITHCLGYDGQTSVRKDSVYQGFTQLMRSVLPGQNVDARSFYKFFNEQFCAIKYAHRDSIREVRIDDWTGKGIKGFTLDVSKF